MSTKLGCYASNWQRSGQERMRMSSAKAKALLSAVWEPRSCRCSLPSCSLPHSLDAAYHGPYRSLPEGVLGLFSVVLLSSVCLTVTSSFFVRRTCRSGTIFGAVRV